MHCLVTLLRTLDVHATSDIVDPTVAADGTRCNLSSSNPNLVSNQLVALALISHWQGMLAVQERFKSQFVILNRPFSHS